jgi:putative hydrolase of the HAD superfamily
MQPGLIEMRGDFKQDFWRNIVFKPPRSYDYNVVNDLVKALIFDLDDTLIVEEASAIEAFYETSQQAERIYGVAAEKLGEAARKSCMELWRKAPARQYCLDIHISSREALWAQFEGEDANLKLLHEWSPYYRLESWTKALSIFGIRNSALAALLAETYVRNRLKKQVLYPEVKVHLDQLSKEFSLAILSNGLSELQRKKINATGISRYFIDIVISEEVGFGKPDTRIFELSLSRLNLSPEQTWMIGDNLVRDIQPAKALGMRTVWLNREAKKKPFSRM